jgi:hypothetical protein
MTGGGNFVRQRFLTRGFQHPTLFRWWWRNRVGSGAAALEIEIGGAIARVGPGVDLAFLGEVLRLLKATA